MAISVLVRSYAHTNANFMSMPYVFTSGPVDPTFLESAPAQLLNRCGVVDANIFLVGVVLIRVSSSPPIVTHATYLR